ncbi:MAG: ABC transporter ATP-binding protein, partial [Candidatus Bathyarchaeota archaeon]|jgi:ABC-type Fe3+/spermidine/putrescine transport system ATPase subunit|nr:ABC transporter ATP-binding protein [Candidatus Bathyarchaeota archaeon]
MKSLTLENICKNYGNAMALDHVSLAIEPKEFMVVMGPSGCGKTTLLLTILGALKPDEGHIFMNGENIDNLPVEARGIGYVPQDFGLFPHLTVRQNVSFGLEVKNTPRDIMSQTVERMLSFVELDEFADRRPNELSGGERQRVALARALATNPSILLLDEPLSSIDEATKSDVRERLKSILREAKATTVCVIHTPEDAFALGDRIAVMNQGQIIQLATPSELLRNPRNSMVKRLIASIYVQDRE